MLIRLLTVALLATTPLAGLTQEKQSGVQVSPKDIHPQPNRQSKLSAAQLGRIKKLQVALSEVDDSSLDKWIEDFEKDRDPEREIRIWEAMAKAYQAYCSEHALNIRGKGEVMGLLLLRSGTTSEEAIQQFQPEVLTAKEGRDVVGLYRLNAEPITVERKEKGGRAAHI
jgi:hypothetical protein